MAGPMYVVLALPYTTAIAIKDKDLNDEEILKLSQAYNIIRFCETEIEASFELSTYMSLHYGDKAVFKNSRWEMNGKTRLLPGLIMPFSIYKMMREGVE